MGTDPDRERGPRWPPWVGYGVALLIIAITTVMVWLAITWPI